MLASRGERKTASRGVGTLITVIKIWYWLQMWPPAGGIVVFVIMQVAAVFLAAIAMSMAVAHALELPGKLRLSKENYVATQTIYYPGFTIGGIGEGLSIIAALTLFFFTPTSDRAFWGMLAGFVCLVA